MADVRVDDSQRGRAQRRAQSAWWLAEATLGLVLLFCPLAIATVHPLSVAIAAGLAMLALALAALATLRSEEPFQVPAPALVFAGVVAFIGLQLVPFPAPVVGSIAPRTRELFDFVLGPLGAYPAWRPLSLDPSATARELAKALTYLAIFLAAVQVTRSRRAKTRLVTLVGVSGIAVAVIGFGHALWGATALFGVFQYGDAAPAFLSTFGNPNHLASFLALSGTALLSRVLTERDRKIATLWAFGYVATGVGVLLTLSRGGIVTFVATQGMLAIAVLLARKSEREGAPLKARSLAVPGAALAVLSVAAYLAWDALAAEIATADSLEKLRESKIALWPSFLPLVKAHWLAGVGRGAFEAAYQQFQLPGALATFTHPENILFQWTSEVGIPAALLFLGGCAFTLLAAVRRATSDAERLACIFGLAGVALHEMVDFGLELGGLAAPATFALAVAVSRQTSPPALRSRKTLILVPAMAALAVAALIASRGSLHAEGEALRARAASLEAEALAGEAARFAVRHPADYFPHLLAAQAFAAERPLRPARLVAFANRAMFLAPSLPLPHRLAAVALKNAGHPEQACIEYRLAYALGDHTVLRELVRVLKTPELMVAAVPDEPEPLARLADELISQKRFDEAEVVTGGATERHGEQIAILQRMARIASGRGELDQAFRWGERITELAPEQPAGLQIRVQSLVTKGDTAGALSLLEDEGLKRFALDSNIVLNLAGLRLGRGDTKGCREALKRLPEGMSPAVRVSALMLEARAAERDGHLSKAISLMRTAVNLRPGDSGVRWKNALLLERAGRPEAAVREAMEAAALAPKLREEAEKLKARTDAKAKALEEAQIWNDLTASENAASERPKPP